MRTYKLFIQEYNIMVNDYITREEIVKTNDIYHEIGKIYCQSLVKIKRIDYLEITKDLQQEIKRLNNIINELEKWLEESIEKRTEDYLDWKYDKNVYLAGCKKLQNVFDKLQELKGSDKE